MGTNIIITGLVVDKVTKNPAAGVMIKVFQTGRDEAEASAATDAQGVFQFEFAAEKDHPEVFLKVSREGKVLKSTGPQRIHHDHENKWPTIEIGEETFIITGRVMANSVPDLTVELYEAGRDVSVTMTMTDSQGEFRIQTDEAAFLTEDNDKIKHYRDVSLKVTRDGEVLATTASRKIHDHHENEWGTIEIGEELALRFTRLILRRETKTEVAHLGGGRAYQFLGA